MSGQAAERSVRDLSAEELVKRAISGSFSRHSRKGQSHPRWVAVASTFQLGSTFARELCGIYGFDPDEEIAR